MFHAEQWMGGMSNVATKQAMIDLEHENMQRLDVAKAVNKIMPLFGQIETALTDISEWPRGNFLLQEFLDFKCECETMANN